MQCNHDVKFIGSAYVGLSAIVSTAKRVEERFPSISTDKSVLEENSRRAMTTFMNSLLGRQEISHPQVMSYLLRPHEKADHYTSHKFSLLRWYLFDTLVAKAQPDAVVVDGEDLTSRMPIPTEENVTLSLSPGSITTSNQRADYCFRPRNFEDMSLYEFVSSTTKQAGIAGKNDSMLFSSPNHPQQRTHTFVRRRCKVIPVILGQSNHGENQPIYAK